MAAPSGSAKGNTNPDGSIVEVIGSYLAAAAEEMRATLTRTALNPVIYQVLDFGISVHDARPRSAAARQCYGVEVDRAAR